MTVHALGAQGHQAWFLVQYTCTHIHVVCVIYCSAMIIHDYLWTVSTANDIDNKYYWL